MLIPFPFSFFTITTDDASIRDAIDEAADKFDVTLTEEQKEQLLDLLKKIGNLDLDVDNLVNQAKSIYDKIENLGADGIFDKIGSFFSNLFPSGQLLQNITAPAALTGRIRCSMHP